MWMGQSSINGGIFQPSFSETESDIFWDIPHWYENAIYPLVIADIAIENGDL
jgi:hypothetical protein